MRIGGHIGLVLVLCVAGRAGETDDARALRLGRPWLETQAAAARAQPKLLRIEGKVDGSGRIVFTHDSVRYQHRHWGRPTELRFDGEPWSRPDTTPPAWTDLRGRLDLTRAWIVERHGRDVIALERTADGFDLYLCDSPNGATRYAVTIAIPRRG